MKSIIAAGLLLGAAHGSVAVAGPYANVETNVGIFDGSYAGAVTEVHAGYEFAAGEDASIYVQAGPAFVAVDGEPTETEVSAKVGITGDVTENFELYGELTALTTDFELSDDLAIGIKAGATYRF